MTLQDDMLQVDALLWAHTKKINLRDGIKFSLKGRRYLCDSVNRKKRVTNIKKGTQIGATTTKYLEAVHGCVYRKFDQNIIYMMPTVKAVEQLAKVSFDPIFEFNPWLKKMIGKGTNSASQKEINGRSIVFVGAQPQKVGGNTKDSANLRSIPCDAVYRDEIDLMDMDMVEMSKQRLNASKHRLQVNFGSPTYPGYGIDELYDNSDQGKWQIKCDSCGKYTCLAQSFPNSIILKDGRWMRACIHCHKEIFVENGHWVMDFPDRRESGLWMDGLISPMADLEEYMYRYNNSEGTRLSEFMRSILGIATTEAENQLTVQDVYDACTHDMMQMISTGETVMGVDVGKTLHCVIGVKTGRGTYEILNASRRDSFSGVHDLALKMNVKYAVVDAMPDIHAARSFQKSEPYTVFLCQYSESQPGKPKFDLKSGIVKVNRNEWCDRVHEVFSEKKIRIPRQSVEIDEYALELTKTAKTLIEHPETGIPKPRWIKLSGGDDHYYHATLYMLLAASRSGIRRPGTKEKPKFTKQLSNFRL